MLLFPRILTAVCLAAWFGAMLFFSSGVAPVAFATLPTRQLAGSLVNASIARLHLIGYVACAGALLGLVWRVALAPSRLAWIKAGLAAVMLALTLVSGLAITPPMAEIRARMGAIDALPVTHPDRARFDWLHQLSVGVMGANMLVTLLLIGLDRRE